MNKVILLVYIMLVFVYWWQCFGSTIKSSIFELILCTGIKEWLMNFFKGVLSFVILGAFLSLGVFFIAGR